MKELSNQVVTVGPARQVERSRIWLQGKRLIEAGFKPGDKIAVTWDTKKGRVTIEHQFTPLSADRHEVRTVSGKGETPIIDITGARVRDFFTSSHVEVSYYAGRIVIREAQ